MNLFHGFGRMEWANGKIYYGKWERGVQNGEGELILRNGIKKIGVWKHGKLNNLIKSKN